MATLKNTTIEGDFRAEDQIMDLTYQLFGTASDPDQVIPGFSGMRINRGSEPDAALYWDEDDDRFLIGEVGNLEQVLTESDLQGAALSIEEGDSISLGFNASTGNTVISVDAAGQDGSVQFNSLGLLSADPGLTYDEGTQVLTAGGGVDVADGSAYTFDGGSLSGLFIRRPGNIGLMAIGQHGREMIDLAVSSGSGYNTVISTARDEGAIELSGFYNFIAGTQAANDVKTSFNTYIGSYAGGGSHSQDSSLADGTSDGNIYLGAFTGWGAGTSRNSVFIGSAAGFNFNEDNDVGKPWNNVAIGASAMRRARGAQNFALGTSSMSDFPGGQANVFIGNFAGTSDTDYTQPAVSGCVVLGDDAHSTASNQFVIGTPADKGPAQTPRIRDVYIGQGVEALTPEDITIHATRAQVIEPNASLGFAGKNQVKQGGDITLQSGEGAGNASGSAIIFRTPTSAGVADYQQQPTEERLNVSENGTVFRNADIFFEDVSALGSFDQIIVRDQATGLIGTSSATDISDIIGDITIDADDGLTSAFNASSGVTTIGVDLKEGDFPSEGLFRDPATGEFVEVDFAFGSEALGFRYEGERSFTMGTRVGSVSSDSGSYAIGTLNEAFGFRTFGIGVRNTLTVTNVNSSSDIYVFGRDNTATGGRFMFAVGEANNLSMNGDTTNGSYAFGEGNVHVSTDENVYSFGRGNVIRQDVGEAYLFGRALDTSTNNVVIFGKHNRRERDVVIGVGTSTTNRIDAFHADSDGSIGIGDIDPPGADTVAVKGRVEFGDRLAVPSTIQPGFDSSQVLVRNPSTNELEYIPGALIATAGLEAGSGLVSDFNASTGVESFSLDESGRVLQSDDGSRYFLSVTDDGNLQTTLIEAGS